MDMGMPMDEAWDIPAGIGTPVFAHSLLGMIGSSGGG
jgi:hypothetical protein